MERPSTRKPGCCAARVLIVAFSAILPLMTVVNYSCRTPLAQPVLLERRRLVSRNCSIPRPIWAGASLTSIQRNLLFSAIILAIEVPLGIVVALSMPRDGWQVAACLVILALPLLIPWKWSAPSGRSLAGPTSVCSATS